MYRPIVKYALRVALFASAIAAVACATPTAPAVRATKPAAKDLSDTLRCEGSGWQVVNGEVVCGAGH
jgi:hypothetical protein